MAEEAGNLRESLSGSKGIRSPSKSIDNSDKKLLLEQISELKQQNETLMRQNYQSPNFANAANASHGGSESQNLPDGIHRPDENTFGNAEFLQK